MPETTVEPRGLLSQGYLSHSQISKYRQCGKAYELSYVQGIQGQPNGAAAAGSAIHSTIEVCEIEDWWKDPEQFERDGRVHTVFRRKLLEEVTDMVDRYGEQPRWGGRKSKDFPDGENQLWWAFTGRVMLAKYSAVRRRDAGMGLSMMEHGVEQQFSILLPNPDDGEPLLIKGYIDLALLQDGDTGEVRVRDWKSGSNLSLDPTQLGLYGMAVQQVFDVPCHVGEFGWLRAAQVDTILKPHDLDPMYPVMPELVWAAQRGITAGIFDMRPTLLCKSCSVRSACPWGKTLPDEE